MDRTDYLNSFRALCAERFRAHEAMREQDPVISISYNPAHRDHALGMLTAATTIGEIVRIMNVEGWSHRVLVTFLVAVSVPDASEHEFDGLFPEERGSVPPPLVGPTPTSEEYLVRLKRACLARITRKGQSTPRGLSAATRIGDALNALLQDGWSVDRVMRSVVEAEGVAIREDELDAWNDAVRFPDKPEPPCDYCDAKKRSE